MLSVCGLEVERKLQQRMNVRIRGQIFFVNTRTFVRSPKVFVLRDKTAPCNYKRVRIGQRDRPVPYFQLEPNPLQQLIFGLGVRC